MDSPVKVLIVEDEPHALTGLAELISAWGYRTETARDGLEYKGTKTVAKGSSSPLEGKFNDKTAIEVDRTGGTCDGNVYFAWSRFTASNSNIYFVRSTDHGVTFSSPALITSSAKNVQDPEIAVTGNGHVYVTWDQGSTSSGQPEGIGVAKSTNCGATFSPGKLLASYQGYEAEDVPAPTAMPQPQAEHDDAASADREAAGSTARLRRTTDARQAGRAGMAARRPPPASPGC